MKIRNGFVSNSSSSSFICDFCGCIESGYDCNLEDFEMTQCENGHTFCYEHMDKNFEIWSIDGFNYLKKLISENKFYMYGDNSEKLKVELISLLDKCIEEKNCSSHKLTELKHENELLKNYDIYGNINDVLYDYGIPKIYCPVCKRLEEMKKDDEYDEYKRLWQKFNEVNPRGCK